MYSRRSSRLRLIGDPRELSTPCWLRGIVSTRCIEIGAWGGGRLSTRGWGRLALRASKRGSPLSYQTSRARDRLTCRPARPLRPPVRAARRVLIGGSAPNASVPLLRGGDRTPRVPATQRRVVLAQHERRDRIKPQELGTPRAGSSSAARVWCSPRMSR